jgi:hypothetical protein
MSEPKKPDDEGNTPSPVNPDDDPNRDADKPRYPAPAGAGEGGSSRNPEGASGPPPSGVQLPPGQKT